MELDVIVGLAETLTIVGGIIYAIVQIRHSHRQRSRESALQLLHSFQTPEFHQAVTIVANLPEGLSKKEIEKKLGDKIPVIDISFPEQGFTCIGTNRLKRTTNISSYL